MNCMVTIYGCFIYRGIFWLLFHQWTMTQWWWYRSWQVNTSPTELRQAQVVPQGTAARAAGLWAKPIKKVIQSSHPSCHHTNNFSDTSRNLLWRYFLSEYIRQKAYVLPLCNEVAVESMPSNYACPTDNYYADF